MLPEPFCEACFPETKAKWIALLKDR
jgi:hypothetical protein